MNDFVMNDMLQAPAEFYSFAGLFGADGFDGVKDEREAIEQGLKSLDNRGRRILKQFLTDLLDRKPSEAELRKLWNGANHHYYIVGRDGNDGVRTFLATVRDQID
jgi:hypothetical protein